MIKNKTHIFEVLDIRDYNNKLKKELNIIPLLVVLFFASCSPKQKSNLKSNAIRDHVTIKVFTYLQDQDTLASAMPELKDKSELMPYKRRFDYLLINNSKIHSIENASVRKKIWSLYPDTAELKELYLQEYVNDSLLNDYFQSTMNAIEPKNQGSFSFDEKELMEVASKFFYCDKVLPDSSIQSHVCIGLNGVSEANWSKDYTLLEAFCYEAIFHDLSKDSSALSEVYKNKKKLAIKKYRPNFTTTDQYLLNVREELFKAMNKDSILQKLLLDYYANNKSNLAFKITP